MEYIVTAVITVVLTILFVLIYKFGLKPQYVPTSANMSQCPDMWNYNSSTKMCEPGYSTHCLPFNPTVNTLVTMSAKCNLARSCGTSWSGMCG